MKKVMSYLPARLIAAFLCIVFALTSLVSLLGSYYVGQLPNQVQQQRQSFESISKNYSAWLLESYANGFLETAEEVLEDTNFNYAIIQTDSDEVSKVDLTDPEIYLAGDPEAANLYQYSFAGKETYYYIYRLDSSADLFFYNYTARSYPSGEDSSYNLYGIDFNQDTGLFYATTSSYAYLIPQVELTSHVLIGTEEEYEAYLNGTDSISGIEDYVNLYIEDGNLYGISDVVYHLGTYQGKPWYLDDEDQPLDIYCCDTWKEINLYDENGVGTDTFQVEIEILTQANPEYDGMLSENAGQSDAARTESSVKAAGAAQAEDAAQTKETSQTQGNAQTEENDQSGQDTEEGTAGKTIDNPEAGLAFEDATILPSDAAEQEVRSTETAENESGEAETAEDETDEAQTAEADSVKAEIAEDSESGSTALYTYASTDNSFVNLITDDQMKTVWAYDFSLGGNYITINTDAAKPNLYVLSWTDDPLESCGDLYTQCIYWQNVVYAVSGALLPIQVVSILLFLLTGIFWLIGVGHRPEDEGIHLNTLDRLPYVIVLAAGVVLEAIIFTGIAMMTNLEISWMTITSVAELALLFGVLGMFMLGTTVVRIKAGVFWKYTLIYMVWHGGICTFTGQMSRLAKAAGIRVSFLAKAIGLLVVVFLIDLFFLWCFLGVGGGWGSILIWLLLSSALKGGFVIWAVLQFETIEAGVKRIIGGNTEEPIDTTNLYYIFEEHAASINQLGVGIEKAVLEKIKSEHLRTELITNVSHDIKTPLTSIINYVDLIKREAGQNRSLQEPPMTEYIEVLDRQSAKLKKLIQDLIDASKASTGNVEVHKEPMDARVLLDQAIGEFSERLDQKGLKTVISGPEPPIMVMADGCHLWRVFDNLLGNICKYALPGTRVYINLTQEGGETAIIFRNISAEELNISSDELMERFVRGDSSRNTEGSGLGLSIAQSLMKLMNGSLEISIDGDLFKATVRFHTTEMETAEQEA